ncbi:MAG: type II toxin-antitoxin system HicB family antitoxin [Dehalococcoidia bacterium]|nr:type II toxin-antitoxin system HicB family antitoxin [Dehalococcoidia bacterium]
MKYAYPALFRPTEAGYSVRFPDIKQGATMGETLVEATENAEDFLCGALYEMEIGGKQVPPVSNPADIKAAEGQFVAMVCVDTEEYYRWHETKLVNKTVVIPAWMNREAQAANINFSRVLQTALSKELQLAAVK